LPSAPRKSHVGDCLELRSIRKTLESVHEEIRYCLNGLRVLEDKVMGRSNSLGSSISWPNSLLPERTSSSQGPSKTAQPSKGKAPLQFPIKRPKFLFKSKAGSVLRPVPSRQSSLDAGASPSAGQSETLGSGPAALRSSGKPGFPGRVYQRRKLRSQLSSAVWKIKLGQSKLDAGTSQIKEKMAVSSMIGDQDTSPASDELPCGGLGEPNVLQLVDRQLEELAVSGLGMDSNDSRQSGLGSSVATKATELGERGFVVGNGFSLALSAEGGGQMLSPQVTSSQLNVGQGSSGFGVGSVTQRQEEGSLELVIFSATEGKVGFESEVFSRGPLVGKRSRGRIR
jgi:hypothetical protein